jgi:hypothetical protein
MSAFRFSIAVTLVLAAGARAQVLDGPPQPVDVMTAVPMAPFKIETLPRTYLGNVADTGGTHIFDNGTAFGVYRTDPRLVAGINLTRNVAIETGYTNLVNRGHYRADYARPDDVGGALAVKGFHSYLATRLTVPLGERLQAVGKLGVAHSEYSHPVVHKYPVLRGASTREIDIGAYVSAGLQYRLSKNATLVGAWEQYGNSAQRWGVNTNNNGFSTRLNMNF